MTEITEMDSLFQINNAVEDVWAYRFCTLWQRFINFILKVNFQSKIKGPLPRQWHECRCLYIFYSTASISVNICGICVSLKEKENHQRGELSERSVRFLAACRIGD